VELSALVVETVPCRRKACAISYNINLRWSRAIRDASAGGYIGFDFYIRPHVVLVTVITANGARWSWELFAGVTFLRLLVALVIGRVVLADRQLLRNLWLIPLRDITAIAVWIASFPVTRFHGEETIST